MPGDTITPVDEVMHSLDALVRSGKVRYIGLSDTPAWYLARAETIAEWRGFAHITALQLEYSLVERNIEREHVPAAIELGMGICPWSPLASGLLSGKYTSMKDVNKVEGRLGAISSSGNPGFTKLMTQKNFDIAAELVKVAREIERSPAQVALNWITKRPGVASTIIGASKMPQLEDNLAALAFDIPPALSTRLEEISRPPTHFPYHFFDASIQSMITGGTRMVREPRWYRG
jgi:aryl-alcohol dehydrogenase-like predicted oxidoreductase